MTTELTPLGAVGRGVGTGLMTIAQELSAKLQSSGDDQGQREVPVSRTRASGTRGSRPRRRRRSPSTEVGCHLVYGLGVASAFRAVGSR